MIEPSGGWFMGAVVSERRRHAPNAESRNEHGFGVGTAIVTIVK
jgi:hypothetical protein